MKKKILLVDDEKNFTELLKMNLEAMGDYEVVEENDALRAIETALDCHPDLVLLDIIMPGMEGPDVLRLMKENTVLKKVPVVFLTAIVKSEEVGYFENQHSGYKFISKTNRVSDLLYAIEENMYSQSN